jgi:uncharacterized protein (TIGR00369 family)
MTPVFPDELARLVPPMPMPLERIFEAYLGLEIHELTPERCAATLEVRDELKQVMGLVHGGVYASMAESLASWATNAGVVADGRYAVGLSNQSHFLRPITKGTVHASASRRHAGGTVWLWDVDISDGEGRLCATSRVTMAVREAAG